MKSNYISTKAEAKRMAHEAAKQECENMQDEFYKQEAANIVEQMTAMHLYILARDFGFGKERLSRFMNACNGMYDIMMQQNSFFGKDMNTKDIKKHIEDKYGLDLTLKELKIKGE